MGKKPIKNKMNKTVGLTAAQKKLPKALQEAILKKQKKAKKEVMAVVAPAFTRSFLGQKKKVKKAKPKKRKTNKNGKKV